MTGAWRSCHRGPDRAGGARCHNCRHRATRGRCVAGDDQSLTVSDAVQWCAGAISHREAARLRQLTAQAEKERAEKDGTTAPNIDDRADMR